VPHLRTAVEPIPPVDRPIAMNPTLARSGIAALALAALGGSFAAGAAWSGPDPIRSGRFLAAPERPGIGAPALRPARSCQELLDWYVAEGLDLVTEYGWGGVVYAMEDRAGAATGNRSGGMEGDAAAPGTQTQTSSETGTNVQETGVDEPDVVKTDGRILVQVDEGELTTYDVGGSTVRELGGLRLTGADRKPSGSEVSESGELLLVGDRAVVLVKGYDPETGEARTTVLHVDLRDPARPVVESTTDYTAELLSARQYGDTVRLVLSTGLPQLDFVFPEGDRGRNEARRENRRLVRESTLEDWLPAVSQDGGDRGQLAGCNDMTIPSDATGLGSLTVVGFDAGSPEDREVTGITTASTTVYSATDRLYVATSSPGQGWFPRDIRPREGFLPWDGGVLPTEDTGTTQLHAFGLEGTSADYLASGEVEGHVADRWSLDSADGVLRVAVGPSRATGNFNSVVTLAEEDGGLRQIGRVDRLGVDEEIKSVRWFDDLAFVVTFRQVDPLYAIDLSDPARPRLLGELKIPGFSEYLHPLGDDLLLGVGADATDEGVLRGGQVAVFDISDLARPTQVDRVGYGPDLMTMAGQDPRQFTWLPGRRTALTAVGSWGDLGGATGWVSVLTVRPDGTLANRMVEATHGYEEVADLRTVPLPDGRVVLAADDAVRFLPL
jgi:hypothetical protein